MHLSAEPPQPVEPAAPPPRTLLCLHPPPGKMHLSSQLQDHAAWGHQQVKVFSKLNSSCISQGRKSHRGTQRSSEKTRTGGFPFCLLAGPSSMTTPPRLVPEPSIHFPKPNIHSQPFLLFLANVRLCSGPEHSQLVGTAVVELELRADKRPPRLPRLQLQDHAKPVWGCKPEPVSPASDNEGSNSRRGGTRFPPARGLDHLLLG